MGVEISLKSIAVDLLGGIQVALQAFEDLLTALYPRYNMALKSKDALDQNLY